MSKLKTIDRKIQMKTQTLSRLSQVYDAAKSKMENLYHKKGMDLIKEWGIMNKKSTYTNNQQQRFKRLEEVRKKKGSITPKINKSSSYSAGFAGRAAAIKPKFEKSGTIGNLKPNAKKLNEELRKEKDLQPENIGNIKKQEFTTRTIQSRRSKPISSKTHLYKIPEISNMENDSHSRSNTNATELKSKEDITMTNTENTRKRELRKNRQTMSSSLIGISMNEIARTNRVKSEFHAQLTPSMSTGKLFSCLNARIKIGGLLNEEVMSNENVNDDTKSQSALSLTSRSLLAPLNNPMIGLSFSNLTGGD